MITHARILIAAAVVAAIGIGASGAASARSSGGGGNNGNGGGTRANAVTTTGKLPFVNTQGNPPPCKGPSCTARPAKGPSSHCERFGQAGGHGGGQGGFCN